VRCPLRDAPRRHPLRDQTRPRRRHRKALHGRFPITQHECLSTLVPKSSFGLIGGSRSPRGRKLRYQTRKILQRVGDYYEASDHRMPCCIWSRSRRSRSGIRGRDKWSGDAHPRRAEGKFGMRIFRAGSARLDRGQPTRFRRRLRHRWARAELRKVRQPRLEGRRAFSGRRLPRQRGFRRVVDPLCEPSVGPCADGGAKRWGNR